MSDDAESTSVKLKSKQEEVFEVEKEVACRSVTVKNMVDDTETLNAPVPLPMVDSKILIKVIEYCKYHHKAEQESLPEDEKNVWDKDFVKVDDETLFNLILAANYLDIKSLLDLTCKTVADEIKGKTPEEIRVRFNIKNDFTPEECVAAPPGRLFLLPAPLAQHCFLFCQLAGRKKSNERTHGARSAKPGGRAGSRLRGPTESPSVAYYA